MKSAIFISHRHEDQRIADVLRKHLQLWGVSPDRLFQSSEPTAREGPNIGSGIRDEVVRALTATELLILVYTRTDVDWSWCMWEAGVATDPESPSTRVVVLECDGQAPAVFADRVVLQPHLESLEAFVRQFHLSPDFLPESGAFAPGVPEVAIAERATLLHRELQECLAARSESAAKLSEPAKVEVASQVFLCHSSADKELVRALYWRLRDDGFKPWLDEEDLLGGQSWKEEIPKALRSSDVVVVCLSHNCVTKAGYVQKEIKIALDVLEEQPEGRVFVVPIKLEDCGIPSRLEHLHCLNYFSEGGHERLSRSLRAAIRAARGDLSVGA